MGRIMLDDFYYGKWEITFWENSPDYQNGNVVLTAWSHVGKASNHLEQTLSYEKLLPQHRIKNNNNEIEQITEHI